MHIYIDESGLFAPIVGGPSKFSCVAALVIPTHSRRALFKEVGHLKRRWQPRGGELKGREMQEDQFAQLLDLLAECGCIVDACICDLAGPSGIDVGHIKRHQANVLLDLIDRRHESAMVQDVAILVQRLNDLPDQLFLQSILSISLITRLIETATRYYAQRTSPELGRFVWRIDAKASTITEMEDLWSTLLFPILQSMTQLQPIGMIPGGDYSHFSKFFMGELEGHKGVINTRRLIGKELSFGDSANHVGLQLADVVASAVSRAFNRTLRPEGWSNVGRLFVLRANLTVRLIHLTRSSEEASRRDPSAPHVNSVISANEEAAQQMMVDPESVRHASIKMGLGG